MWDLKVPGNNDHYFYVAAGDTPVLNSDCGPITFYHASDINSLLDILNNGWTLRRPQLPTPTVQAASSW